MRADAVAGLTAEVEGLVAVPGEPGYEVADQLFNAATQVGPAPVNGASPLVGTVGYTLGGVGPLSEPYGYAAAHVRELELVLADASLVTAASEQHPDLFWAARGGKDNFGVVTHLVTDLVPVFPGEAAAEVLGAPRVSRDGAGRADVVHRVVAPA